MGLSEGATAGSLFDGGKTAEETGIEEGATYVFQEGCQPRICRVHTTAIRRNK